MSIKELKASLESPWFVQCNKGSIVNVYHVDSFDRYRVVMSNGDVLSITENRADAINKCYTDTHMNTTEPGTVYSVDLKY